MLKEHRNVRQEPGHRRRWFEGEGIDLIVWLDSNNLVDGFQICREDHALTWRRDAGFAYGRVDEGDESPLKNLSPIIVPNGAIPWTAVISEFQTLSDPLEPPLRELILSRLVARK
ncbi:MAG: hypothetical protein JWM35_523 [Verrucomicrobia bacterium]|nr:hypothetical protein [Verrucomicrobiota bacterium]